MKLLRRAPNEPCSHAHHRKPDASHRQLQVHPLEAISAGNRAGLFLFREPRRKMAGRGLLRPAVLSEEILARPRGHHARPSTRPRSWSDATSPTGRCSIARGWEHILQVHGGRLPVVIRAVPEGTAVPGHNVLMTIENTDPACYWLPNYLETLLVQVWYGSTVATQSREMKNLDPELSAAHGRSRPDRFQAPRFRLSRRQQRRDGGRGRGRPPAELPGHRYLRGHRGRPRLLRRADGRLLHPRRRTLDHHLLGPRATKSTPCGTCSSNFPAGTGRRGERQLRRFRGVREDLGPDAARQRARPRRLPGDPARLGRSAHRAGLRPARACWTFWPRRFGYTVNAKGYKVLNPHVRIIQSDGVDFEMLDRILYAMQKAGFSADNIAFGSGGGLLQKLNRDTLKFAFKCAAVVVDGRRARCVQESGDRSRQTVEERADEVGQDPRDRTARRIARQAGRAGRGPIGRSLPRRPDYEGLDVRRNPRAGKDVDS